VPAAIIFDLDETLLDRRAALERFLTDQFKKHDWAHIPLDAYRKRFFELDQNGYGDKAAMFKTLAGEFKMKESGFVLLLEFRATMGRFATPFPDAHAVVNSLRARGLKIGLITNGTSELQRNKLTHSGIGEWVDVALVSEEERINKPDPMIFHRAAQRLNVAPADCVFVGDHAVNDVQGAQSAGMKAVWFPGEQQRPADPAFAPDFTIESLTQLLDLPL
jgi:putative hydrolase of the HAD superfamily